MQLEHKISGCTKANARFSDCFSFVCVDSIQLAVLQYSNPHQSTSILFTTFFTATVILIIVALLYTVSNQYLSYEYRIHLIEPKMTNPEDITSEFQAESQTESVPGFPLEILDKLHLKDLENPKHPSIFDENEAYNMLILLLPKIIDHEIHTTPINLIFLDEETWEYHQDTNTFEKLEYNFMSPYWRLNITVDNLNRSFLEFLEGIVNLEQDLYRGTDNGNFLHIWLDFKLDLIKFERTLALTLIPLSDFIVHYEEHSNFPHNQYLDIQEHLGRMLEATRLQLNRLDSLHSFYDVQANVKMNKMIYLLTIISAVFLPLNLIVGFFGMNTSDLPFSTGHHGSMIAIFLLIFSSILTGALLWRVGRKGT